MPNDPAGAAAGADDLLPRLVARSAAGDEAAFGELYDRTAHRVFGLAMETLRDRALAEEAAIETFAQAWRQAGSYDARRGSVPSWLFTIARTRAIDLRRARLRQLEREDPLEGAPETACPRPDPERAAQDSQRAARVRAALERLPREQRQLIEAAYYRGLSHSELATAFAQPLGTVKTRIRTGLVALRRALEAQIARPGES